MLQRWPYFFLSCKIQAAQDINIGDNPLWSLNILAIQLTLRKFKIPKYVYFQIWSRRLHFMQWQVAVLNAIWDGISLFLKAVLHFEFHLIPNFRPRTQFGLRRKWLYFFFKHAFFFLIFKNKPNLTVSAPLNSHVAY